MNIRKGVFSTGLLILVAGLFVAALSFAPSHWIQYIVVGSAFSAGLVAFRTGRSIVVPEVASRYIWIEGIVLMLYAIAALAFGAAFGSFISITTLFLLVFGVVEFTLTLQTLSTSGMPNWNIFVQKLAVSAAASIGAVYIYTTAAWNDNLTVLLTGLLTMLIGGSFMRESKHLRAVQGHSS